MPRVLVTFVPDQPGFRAAAESILRRLCPDLLDVSTGPSDLPGHTQLTLVMPDAAAENSAQLALADFSPDLPVMEFQVPVWPQSVAASYGLGRS